MALRPTNLRAALRAAQAAEEGAPRLAMRSQADQARFVAEALKRPDNGWADPYEFRIPGDVVRVGIGRGLDRRQAQSIEWHFQSSKDAVKQFDDLYNSHPDVLTANDINPSAYSWAPRSSYAAYSEANRLRRSAESDVADALGLSGRPSLYGRIEPLSASETARLIRRVGTTIKADADAFGPRSYRWTPVGGPDGSRAKLYRTMVADLPGYKYSPRDKLGDPGAVRQPGAPAPTGDWSTFPGVRGSIKDLPILGVPATAAVGAGALAMQPQDAEAAPISASAARAVEARLARQAARGSERFYDPRLSPQQNKIVEMSRNGFTRQEIADELETTTNIVKTQISVAKTKAPGLEVPRNSETIQQGEFGPNGSADWGRLARRVASSSTGEMTGAQVAAALGVKNEQSMQAMLNYARGGRYGPEVQALARSLRGKRSGGYELLGGALTVGGATAAAYASLAPQEAEAAPMANGNAVARAMARGQAGGMATAAKLRKVELRDLMLAHANRDSLLDTALDFDLSGTNVAASLTSKARARVAQEVAAGKTINQIAEENAVTPEVVRAFLDNSTKRARSSFSTAAFVRDMVANGVTDTATIRAALKRELDVRNLPPVPDKSLSVHVSRAKNEIGLTAPKPQWTPEDLARVAEMRARGMSDAAIGREFSRSQQSIFQVRQRNAIPAAALTAGGATAAYAGLQPQDAEAASVANNGSIMRAIARSSGTGPMKAQVLARGVDRSAMSPQEAARIAELQAGLTAGVVGGGLAAGGIAPTMAPLGRQMAAEDNAIDRFTDMNNELRGMMAPQPQPVTVEERQRELTRRLLSAQRRQDMADPVKFGTRFATEAFDPTWGAVAAANDLRDQGYSSGEVAQRLPGQYKQTMADQAQWALGLLDPSYAQRAGTMNREDTARVMGTALLQGADWLNQKLTGSAPDPAVRRALNQPALGRAMMRAHRQGYGLKDPPDRY